MALLANQQEADQLKRMRQDQQARAKAAAASHREVAENLFMQGAQDERSVAVATCCEELLHVVRTGTRKIITVQCWSVSVMGAAAGTLYSVLKLPVVYLGDCTHIDPQTLGRRRTSADLARRLLQRAFPQRMERGEYRQKSDARKALHEELELRGSTPVVFVDATELPLQTHDWDEAAKIAKECGVTFVVSVAARGDSPAMTPLMRPGATAKPTAREPGSAVHGGAALLDKYRTVLLGIIDDWERRRAHRLRRMERLADELEKIPHLPAHARSLVHQAHDILVHEGMLVMESDEEDM